MKRTRIKICGITNVKDALLAAFLGADMIGIICWEHSKRYVELSKVKEITKAAKDNGVVPVAVFVDASLENVQTICQAAQITTIQLHGSKMKQQLHDFAGYYTLFLSISMTSQGIVEPKEEPFLRHPLAEFLIFDHGPGGTGKAFNWDHFQPPKEGKWMLAGGIHPGNIQKALELNPTGVDVASGVERKGTVSKDPHLVKCLIDKVREYDAIK